MKSSLAKNGIVVFGANLLASVFSLMRNILLARMLGPENYGVGAVFVLVLTFLDMASNLSLDRQIVQSEKGFDQKFINNIHFAEFIKGVALALLMYLGAPVYAELLGVESIQWAFELLGIVPLIRGMRNWGIAVEQKDSKFRSTIYVEIMPQLLSLVAIWPLYHFVDDYRVFIYITFIQAIALVVISHLVTKTPYSPRFNKEFSKSIIGFGWPLLLNGLLMYLFLQGDRVLVSRFYGLEMLGYFSAAFSLSIMPVMILGKVVNTLFLPLLSENNTETNNYKRLLVYLCGLLSLLYAMFMYACGEFLYVLIYGSEYIEGAYILGVIGIVHALRILRSAPATLAISSANTKSILISNIIRGVGFLLAVWCAINEYEIHWILVSAGIGEVLSLLYQFFGVKYFGKNILSYLEGWFFILVLLSVVALVCLVFIGQVISLSGMIFTVSQYVVILVFSLLFIYKVSFR